MHVVTHSFCSLSAFFVLFYFHVFSHGFITFSSPRCSPSEPAWNLHHINSTNARKTPPQKYGKNCETITINPKVRKADLQWLCSQELLFNKSISTSGHSDLECKFMSMAPTVSLWLLPVPCCCRRVTRRTPTHPARAEADRDPVRPIPSLHALERKVPIKCWTNKQPTQAILITRHCVIRSVPVAATAEAIPVVRARLRIPGARALARWSASRAPAARRTC